MSDEADMRAAQARSADQTFEGWQKLSWRERRARRLDRWRRPAGVAFVSDEARAAYEERIDLFIDALGGAVTFRLLQGHAPLDARFTKGLIQLLLKGCAKEGR